MVLPPGWYFVLQSLWSTLHRLLLLIPELSLIIPLQRPLPFVTWRYIASTLRAFEGNEQESFTLTASLQKDNNYVLCPGSISSYVTFESKSLRKWGPLFQRSDHSECLKRLSYLIGTGDVLRQKWKQDVTDRLEDQKQNSELLPIHTCLH